MRKNTAQYVKHFEKLILMLRQLDVYTEGKYKPEIDNRIKWQEFQMLVVRQENRKIIKGDYKEFLKEITAKERCKIYMKAICPWLCKINEWRKKYVR